MAVAVVDATAERTRLDLVVDGWVRAGIVCPLPWGVVPEAAEESVAWRLIGGDGESPFVERNEILNQVADRDGLHVAVVVESGHDVETQRLITEVRSITSEFIAAAPGTQAARARCTLVALPACRDDGTWHLETRDELVSGFPWSEVYLVAPEDSPSPQKGTELGRRTIAPVAAHALAAAFDLWTFGGSVGPTTARSTGTPVRLIRAWTRFVDAGFLVDSIADVLQSTDLNPAGAVEERVEGLLIDLEEKTIVRDDLKETKPNLDDRSFPPPWKYVIGAVGYILVHFVPRFVENVVRVLIRPLLERLIRLLRRIAQFLGWRPKSPPTVTPADDAPSDLALEIDRCRRSLEVLASTDELDAAPEPKPELWRQITDHLLEAADSGEVPLEHLTSTTTDSVSVMASLTEDYRKRYHRARDRVGQALADAERFDDRPDEAASTDEAPWSQSMRRRLVRWALLGASVFVVLVMLVTQPQVGILLALAIGLGVFAFGKVSRAFWMTIRELIDEYRARYLSDEESDILERLRVGRFDLERFGYRTTQVPGWAAVLGSVLAAAGQGAPIDPAMQGDFEPGSAPRALRFASAPSEPDRMTKALVRMLRDDRQRLFRTIWSEVESDYRDLYDQRSRDVSDDGAPEVASFHATGLPDGALNAGRAFLWKHFRDDPSAYLDQAYEWTRIRDANGLERITPGPGLAAGPVGRGRDPGGTESGKLRELLATAIHRLDGTDALAVRILADLAVAPASAVSAAEQDDGWTDMDNGLAITSSLPPGECQIGSTAEVRTGRSVIAGASVEGAIQPVWATVQAVHADGSFGLDGTTVALGSPVFDIETETLIGIVTSLEPVVAAGPTALFTCVQRQSSVAVEPGELDPGMAIPFDVLVAQPWDSGGGDAPPPAELGDPLDLFEWLSTVFTERQTLFTPGLVVNSDHLAVDDQSMQSPPGSRPTVMAGSQAANDISVVQLDSGRVLLATSRWEQSVPIPRRQFTTASQGDSADRPDEHRGPQPGLGAE